MNPIFSPFCSHPLQLNSTGNACHLPFHSHWFSAPLHSKPSQNIQSLLFPFSHPSCCQLLSKCLIICHLLFLIFLYCMFSLPRPFYLGSIASLSSLSTFQDVKFTQGVKLGWATCQIQDDSDHVSTLTSLRYSTTSHDSR